MTLLFLCSFIAQLAITIISFYLVQWFHQINKHMKHFISTFTLVIIIGFGFQACADEEKRPKTEITTATNTTSDAFANAANSSGDAEQKLDAFMTAYINGMNTVLAEKDDDVAIDKMNALDATLTPNAQKIAPQIQAWVSGMTESDKKAFEERLASKPYFKSMLEMMFDPRLTTRMEKNPKFKEAFERMNEHTSAVMNEVEKKNAK